MDLAKVDISMFSIDYLEVIISRYNNLIDNRKQYLQKIFVNDLFLVCKIAVFLRTLLSRHQKLFIMFRVASEKYRDFGLQLLD